MDLERLKALIGLVKESGISELEVQSEGERVRIVHTATVAPAIAAPQAEAAAPPQAKTPAPGNVVPAPLSGTFYRAPAPGEPPFVAVGDSVSVGDVLCIIESMKMMNRVKSECAGEVTAVLLDDGQAIESGTGLFRIL